MYTPGIFDSITSVSIDEFEASTNIKPTIGKRFWIGNIERHVTAIDPRSGKVFHGLVNNEIDFLA